LEFRRAVHDDDLSHPLPQTAFDQQRHVYHDQLFASQPSLEDAPKDGARHSGVYDPIQDFSLLGVAEDDAAQLLAVDGVSVPLSLV